jgi:hypothetical protein
MQGPRTARDVHQGILQFRERLIYVIRSSRIRERDVPTAARKEDHIMASNKQRQTRNAKRGIGRPKQDESGRPQTTAERRSKSDPELRLPASPDFRQQATQRRQSLSEEEAIIDTTVEDSFPASDPPALTLCACTGAIANRSRWHSIEGA